MNNPKRLLALAVSAALAAPMAAHATNGMNLEAYGPVAGGMGGASMAYDNGTAAMMNNPATLGMMGEGSRLDVAIGFLKPSVTTEIGGMSSDSAATSFMMPALGYVKSSGLNSYGVGMFSQGGMGTEYSGGILSPFVAMGAAASASAFGGTPTGATATTAGAWDEMSEVGVGRLIFPFARKVNDKVTLGGSIDYVWAGMDLKMVMTGAMMWDMMPTMYNPVASQSMGTLSGTMIDAMMGFGLTDIYGAQFDFADDSPYTGKAKGAGFAGKIGGTFKVNEKLTIGATYHSKTSMSDLKGDVVANMAVGTGGGDMVIPVSGEIAVNDFQWPATMALGIAFQATDKLMIAFDAKRLNWADAMKNFSMTLTASGNTGMAAGFNGTVMDAVMYQNWEDQTVIQLGGAYKVTDATTVRAGYNSSSNPIPDSTMHYLFPAVTETHYTLGLGHVINEKSSVDVALSYVPEVKAGNPAMFTTSMSQTNYQLMYSYKF
jgi:long-chain fatty acid transport protein